MTPRRILAAGWLVFLLYAYPGYMTLTGLDALIASRYGTIQDWNSPVMAKLWGTVEFLIAGPFGMLLLQSGTLLFAAFALLSRVMSARAASITSACVLVFPPVMTTVAVISEDALLAALLVAASALFGSERKWKRFAGFACVVIACGLRDGAWLVTGPIVVFGFVALDGRGGFVRYAIATGVWLSAALVAVGLEWAIVKESTMKNEAALAIADIADMAKARKLDIAQLRIVAPGVRFAPDSVRPLPPTSTTEARALVDARRQMRTDDFGAYVAARWAQWRRILNVTKRRSSPIYTKDSASRDHRFAAAHASRHSAVQRALIGFTRLLEDTPLFSPFMYLALATLLLPFGHHERTALMLLVSAIVMQLVLAVASWNSEYRYSTWPIVATILAVVFITRAKLSSRKVRTQSQP